MFEDGNLTGGICPAVKNFDPDDLNRLRRDLSNQNGGGGMRYRDFGARVFAGDIDVSTQVVRKRLNNAGSKASFGIGGVLRKTNTIVVHCQSPVVSTSAVIDQYPAGTIVGEGMFEGVNHQFGDNQAQAYGRIRRRDAVIRRHV